MDDSAPDSPSAARLRLAALLLGAGLLAAALVALPVAPTDLDRHQFPKESVFHLAVLAAALAAGRGVLTTLPRTIRWLLVAIVLWSGLGLVVATNPWLTVRAATLTASGALAFATSHFLTAHGQRSVLLRAAALAALLAVATALAQAWGLDHAAFSPVRAPGGTLGNRNFVAHLAAIALPLAVTALLAARQRFGMTLAAILITAIVVILILTRSRAGWLAGAGGMGAVGAWLLLLPTSVRSSLPRRRLLLGASLAAGGVVIALAVPNTLEWRSDSPYTDTLGNLANYREGSGRGRLLQYQHTGELALRHPVLGVGAGNWALRYGDVAPSSDPSWARNDVIPLNPWPSSDWMALVSERGIPLPLMVLLLGGLLLAISFRHRGESLGAGLRTAALAGTLAAAVTAGLFDAVLLLAVPLSFVAVVSGALLPVTHRAVPAQLPTLSRRLLLAFVVVGAVRSVQQTSAYVIAGGGRSRHALQVAVRVDPFSFPIQIALARSGPCRMAAPHARAALRLAPTWPSAQRVAKRC